VSETTKLLTPIYLKTEEHASDSDDPVSYLLTGNGLFIRRRHAFFTSCVAARDWPSELLQQEPHLELRCPKLPQAAMERIVGFFSRIERLHGSEAAAILLYDRRRESVSFEVPEQVATVTEGWNGERYATDVRYEMPQLAPDIAVFGSVHSHADGPAYSSHVDCEDESHRTGLHIVVGRVEREPPEIHCEYVVDGVRFKVDAGAVIEGYQRRDTDVPAEWIERVEVETKRYEARKWYSENSFDRGPARRTRSVH
jgi:proteasome lid subunit RPN8/RPN11